VSLRDGYF